MKTKVKLREVCTDKEKIKKEKEMKKRIAKTEREIWGYINEGRKKKTNRRSNQRRVL